MTRGWKIGLGVFAALLLAAYLSLWIYSAQWFGREIDTMYANAEKDGVEFLGPKPAITNFPFVPEMLYTNGIKTGNAIILFPELKLRGYPLPFLVLSMDFPKGIALDGIADPSVWSLDRLSADIVIPSHLPADMSEEELRIWQQKSGKIDVRGYSVVKGSLLSTGKGLLSLDENLQPDFTLESTMKGYEAFIREQADKDLLEPFAAAVGIAMLNSMAKEDAATKEKTVTLNVSVRDRLLSVGPLQALPLPEIAWDRHTPPVQPQ